MNFVQTEFLWFMILVFVLHWSVPKRSWQNVVLVVASAVFYGWIHPWWLLLLYSSAVLDYTMGRLMVRAPQHKGWWLSFSLMGNIGMLLYFKYFNFFIDNVALAMENAGLNANIHTLNILLPAGISFYTFQTMSYTLDIYRGELQPRKNFLNYLVFVSFFPQLVAGPVERASRLLPQLEVRRIFTLDNLRSGFGLAMWGGFKKMVIADTIAPYVDKIFLLEDPSGPMVWAATAGFSLQIYADFSGYTDIARGTARMLGVDLVRNFDEPYMAATTAEFWQRWHMSLSTWIRDYILAPLLGDLNEISYVRFVFAVLVTMVVMGAWHGAGWNYIIFGAYHSVAIFFYIVAERALPNAVRKIPFGRYFAILLHITIVGQVGALMFRERSLPRLISFLTTNPFVANGTDEWRAVLGLLGLMTVLGSPLVVAHIARRVVTEPMQRSVWFLPVQSAMWSCFAVLMFVFYRISAYDFIYFQF